MAANTNTIHAASITQSLVSRIAFTGGKKFCPQKADILGEIEGKRLVKLAPLRHCHRLRFRDCTREPLADLFSAACLGCASPAASPPTAVTAASIVSANASAAGD